MKKLFNALFAITIIKDLKFILNAYNNALKTFTKGNNKYKFHQLVDEGMHAGICHFCSFCKINDNDIKYIIDRNIRHFGLPGQKYWAATPYERFLKREDVMEGIISRVIILEKELKHHKKWRFLAKYIKP